MLALLGVFAFLIGTAFFVGVGVIWYRMSLEEFEQPFLVLCPETMKAADIRVDAGIAVRSRFGGHEEDRIVACSRWPEKRDCDQACAAQVQLLGDSRSFQDIAAFGLQPQQLRMFNPRRMTRELYERLCAQLARQGNHAA